MRVLVVDDSRAMRMIVKRTLRQAGYDTLEVSEAGNGVEAYDQIKVDEPHLVLCDWNMPEMNGIELLQKLRQESINVKFGFVTSEGTTEMQQTATSSGALFLITKPFTPESFKEALKPILG